MYIRAHVFPDSRKEKITRKGETELEIHVREPAQHNQANHRVREIIAGQYEVLAKDARLITGHRSRSKIFDVQL